MCNVLRVTQMNKKNKKCSIVEFASVLNATLNPLAVQIDSEGVAADNDRTRGNRALPGEGRRRSERWQGDEIIDHLRRRPFLQESPGVLAARDLPSLPAPQAGRSNQ